MKCPLLFLGFARIHGFERIIEANNFFLRNRKVYLSLDGATTDEIRCTQNKIVNLFKNNFQYLKVLKFKKNYGCDQAIPKAINWFFKFEDKGIIIEDDIFFRDSFLSLSDFFLKNKYLTKRFTAFVGYNPRQDLKANNFIFFQETNFLWIWGWATTKFSWSFYNANIFAESLSKIWQYTKNISPSFKIRVFLLLLALQTKQGKNKAWDFKFLFSLAKFSQTQLLATSNLVTNYGFDSVSSNCAPTYRPNIICKNHKVVQYKIKTKSVLDDSLFFNRALNISFYRVFRQFFAVLVPRTIFYFIRNKVRPFFFKVLLRENSFNH